MRRLLDFGEPAIELLIRLSGWSAIFFVGCIFVFILKEGGPYLWNKLDYGLADKEYQAGKDAPTQTLPAVELTELPYEVVEHRLLESLREAGAEGKIDGFRDVRQEIGETVTFVVYLEPGTHRERALEQILEVHPLRQNFDHVPEFLTGTEWKPSRETDIIARSFSSASS